MKRNSRYPTQIMLLIRVAVSGYVLYLAYTLFRDRDSSTSMPAWALVLILILFVIIGVGVIVHSVYLYLNGMYEGGKADISVEDEDGQAGASDKDTGAKEDPDTVNETAAIEDAILNTDGAEDAEFTEVEEKEQ